jgi:hypothetical protein
MGEAKRRRAAAGGGQPPIRGGNDYSTGRWMLNIPELRRRPELVRKFVEVFERIPKAERDQIWAEAVHRYKAGENAAVSERELIDLKCFLDNDTGDAVWQ